MINIKEMSKMPGFVKPNQPSQNELQEFWENNEKQNNLKDLHRGFIKVSGTSEKKGLLFVIEQLDRIANETGFNSNESSNFDTESLKNMIGAIIEEETEYEQKNNVFNPQEKASLKRILRNLPKQNEELVKGLKQQFEQLDRYIQENNIDVKKYDIKETIYRERKYDFESDISVETLSIDNLYEQLKAAIEEYQKRVEDYIKNNPTTPTITEVNLAEVMQPAKRQR